MRSIGWLFAMVFTVLSVSSALGADKIKLALNWVPEPEFGGIYAAQQQHFFANNGLDVEIQPGGADQRIGKQTQGGGGQIGDDQVKWTGDRGWRRRRHLDQRPYPVGQGV